MFPSACSLRSTQCAALIALATAAGISRFEPAAAETHSGSTAVARESATSLAAVRTAYFQFVQAFAPWLRAFERLASIDSGSAQRSSPLSSATPAAPDANGPFVPLPSIAAATVARTAAPLLSPSPRQHSFPYAVGPPAWNPHASVRADRTFVLGDSPARPTFSPRPRIARLFRSVSVARLARPEFAGAQVARLISPSSAAIGETEFRAVAALVPAASGAAFPCARPFDRGFPLPV